MRHQKMHAGGRQETSTGYIISHGLMRELTSAVDDFLHKLVFLVLASNVKRMGLTLREILNELSEVTDWYQLGVQLAVPSPKLKEFEKNYPNDAQRCKSEVVDWWLRNVTDISWKKIAQALEAMGEHTAVVRKLQRKFNRMPKWNYLVISCVAVGVALLLLLLVVDLWKLELRLPPHSITAAVGAFTLAVVITKYWTSETSMADKTTEQEHVLERQQHSRLDPVQESTDPVGIFSLPQYIQVMVSNYQPLQTIFAIPKGECQSEKMKNNEQFSPTVTIVDTATQQPLDCVLLLHGEKPPEVTCRTFFCYIAVQVSYCDEHGSHPHSPCHMKSKPCKQGRLQLTFRFHKPGTACVIWLSIHSITDSEGVEYMHHCEDCICVVQIIDRNEHQCHSSDQHGAAIVKAPPFLRYSGSLATAEYHEIAKRFEKFYSPSNYEQIKCFANSIVDSSRIEDDLKAFALCWEASSEIFFCEQYECGEKLLRVAWNKATKLECENGLLLQGMIHRLFAAMYYSTGESEKALKQISEAKMKLNLAAPSKETALVRYRETVVKWRELAKLKDASAEKFESIEEDFNLLLQHGNYMEDYEKPYLFLFHMEKAKFHLRSRLISDELPPEKYSPTKLDLEKAKKCLDRVSLDMLPSEVNFYAVNYYNVHCDLCLWNKQYPEAMKYAMKAKQLFAHEKREIFAIRKLNERIHLIMRLEEINEILKIHPHS